MNAGSPEQPWRQLAGAFTRKALDHHLEGITEPFRAELIDPTGVVLATIGEGPAEPDWVNQVAWLEAEAADARACVRLSAPPAAAALLKATAAGLGAELSAWIRLLRLPGFTESRNEIVSIFSHELRTPLAVIKGLCELLLTPEAVPPSEMPNYLSTIHRNVDRLAGIVSNILVVSKLDQQVPHLMPQLLPASGALDLDLFADMAKAKSLKLSARIEECSVFIDHFAAAQIFNNLISNAVKYTPPGGTVTLSATAEAPDQVHFMISDTGIGIAAEHIPRVFEKFFRVKGPEEQKQPGSGLGMYIVKQYVDLSQGKVWLESTPGKGTTVHVILPASEQAPVPGSPVADYGRK